MLRALLTIITLVIIGVASNAHAQSTTVFTYQGELTQNGAAADGVYDMSFSLWNATAGGQQLGASVDIDGVQVTRGRFSVMLDFGAEAFGDSARWLQITVEGFTLSPRNPITRAPFAVQTRGIFVSDSGAVGIGTTEPLFPLDVVGGIRSAGPTGGAFVAVNPLNPNANLGLNWLDDVARIRIGGTGPGSQSGLDIQSTGNSSLLRILHNGNIGIGTTAPGALLDVAGAGNFRGRLGVGDPSSLFGQLTVLESDAPFAIQAESSDGTFPTVFANNSAPHGPAIWAQGQSDASLDGGGIVVVGDRTAQNIAIDNNEIMARNSDSPATLFLNAEGGAVRTGAHGIAAPFIYAYINGDGTFRSGSGNITQISNPQDGQYEISVEGGFRRDDIIIISPVFGNGHGYVTASCFVWHVDGVLYVRIYTTDGDPANNHFSFVGYRP